MPHQQIRIDAAQIEALAARQDRHRHLAGFGRGEDELGVRRRLLECLEQRVEGLGREHVHFVENIDLVARAHRGVADRIVDLPHVLDAVVRGRVHLDDVGVPALHDGPAVNPDRGHIDGRRADRAVRQLVVERPRQDARRRGLADAAHPGEDPGLRDARGRKRVRDRTHHGVLTDQVAEIGRAIFARQHPIGAVRAGRGRTFRDFGTAHLDTTLGAIRFAGPAALSHPHSISDAGIRHWVSDTAYPILSV
jgi:hypothetical protein